MQVRTHGAYEAAVTAGRLGASWPYKPALLGPGRDDDERYRIAATADGGVFVLRTPYPEPRREPDPIPSAWPLRPASLDDVFGARDEP